MLSSTQKGAIAEAVIAAEAIKAGIEVLRPLAEGCRYDLLFDLDPDTQGCYWLPIGDVRGRWEVRLRLAKARNNQEFAISYAADYDFHGAIAQLGERVTGSHEVRGSSPLSSMT